MGASRMLDLRVQPMLNTDRVILKDADRTCYVRTPKQFHGHVIALCDRLFS